MLETARLANDSEITKSSGRILELMQSCIEQDEASISEAKSQCKELWQLHSDDCQVYARALSQEKESRACEIPDVRKELANAIDMESRKRTQQDMEILQKVENVILDRIVENTEQR